jgi:hypothetical protein
MQAAAMMATALAYGRLLQQATCNASALDVVRCLGLNQQHQICLGISLHLETQLE